MEGLGDPVSPPIDPARPETNENFRFGIDLFNAGFFWESHVYFESLWNAHGRVGPVADLLKGLIKLGAAGVKKDLNQKVSAREHEQRAEELFLEVMKAEGETYLGIPLARLIDQLHSETEVKILPNWG